MNISAQVNAKTLPLSGMRILDCGIITAGATTSAVLADGGAEVFKVESSVYSDPFRGWVGDNPDNKVPTSALDCNNRNKFGIGLNLKHEGGKRLFLELARHCDAVVENFRCGVMDRLGIGYAELEKVNPRIVLASVSSIGSKGIDPNFSSYGTTLEALGGLAYLSGHADGPPMVTGRNVNLPDQLVPLFAAGAIVAAVGKARRDGRGAHVDLAQRELTTFMIAALITSPDAELRKRRGNQRAGALLQACVLTSTEAIGVSIASSDEMDAVMRLVGSADTNGIERQLAVWAAERTLSEAVAALRATGAFATVLPHSETLLSLYRNNGLTFATSPSGKIVKAPPFRLVSDEPPIRRDAPALGQDTERVLKELLDLSDAEIASHRAAGAIECL